MKKLIFSLLFLLSFTHSTYSQIVINEIMIDGATCDGSCNPNTAEWVELYNSGNSIVDISCYIISDGDWTYVFPIGTTIPPNGYITIGGASNESSNPDFYWDDANYTGTGGIGTFTNGGEQLALFDNTGTMIDGIIWGGGQALSANNIAVTSSGSCIVTDIDLPGASNSDWEDIGTDGVDGSTMARECDGSSTWVNMETTDMTFGSSNGCVVMELDTNNVIHQQIVKDTEPKIIMYIHNMLGHELYHYNYNKDIPIAITKFKEYGILIIRYTDLTVEIKNIN